MLAQMNDTESNVPDNDNGISASELLNGYDPRFISVFLKQTKARGLTEFDLAMSLEGNMAPSTEKSDTQRKTISTWDNLKQALKKIAPFVAVSAVSGATGFVIAKKMYEGDNNIIIHHIPGEFEDDELML